MARRSFGTSASLRAPTPYVNAAFIAINIGMFLVELRLGQGRDAFLARWGLVPTDFNAFLHAPNGSGAPVVVTLLTSAFLHVGWLHLAANMLYLGVFGGAVEARLGHIRYVFFYALLTLVGGVAYAVADPTSPVPAIGASAAVAGVLAANLVLQPSATLGTLAPMLFVQRVRNVPSLLLLVLWVVSQLFVSITSITTATGIAWWAHAGGFVAGLVLAPVLRLPERHRW